MLKKGGEYWFISQWASVLAIISAKNGAREVKFGLLDGGEGGKYSGVGYVEIFRIFVTGRIFVWNDAIWLHPEQILTVVRYNKTTWWPWSSWWNTLKWHLVSVNFISLVTSCVELQEEEPQIIHLMSFTWVSQTAYQMFLNGLRGLWISYRLSPPVSGFRRRRSHITAHPMSFTWASHIASSVLTGH